ncbi:PhoPQ-regulated protein [Salmonella enterica subsp. enterica serovar Albany]|nr:PhoPQ-regulated protein [Salmonella enterica subsp. enterica serovar Duesseldorf]EBQ8977181.1 PhoPQ-regulated protein [Salmonella enterica subsp. enterica serovar Albany]EBS5866279.1 PhoPQ-regulated protein [Salmonella enterica subsp. enterica serovar Albany]ECF2342722.1 PhoPQ-regulated protein [Salmonella enterica subsp. enterica serovar Corvallis]EDR0221369.1 PhoPQ-regulated protein [Salmonella enterica subsp. enterica]
MFKRYLWKLCWLAFALVKRGESMKKIYLVVIVLFFISTKVYTLLHNNIFFCRNSPECDLSHVLPDYREQISGTPLKYTLINTAPLAQVVVRHYELLSQHWSPDDMVTPAQWRHNVDIYIPETAKEHHALVVVNNGINYEKGVQITGKPGDFPQETLASIARDTNTIVISVSDIPNQYLTFQDDKKPLKEDESVSRSWALFMEAPEQRELMPLNIPMVTALSQAMRLAKKELTQWNINSFIITGISKRGWTTWLSAIADPDVEAIVPFAIDLLDIDASLEHIYQSYGGNWPITFYPYYQQGIDEKIKSPTFTQLRQIIDPLRYLNTIYQPRLAIPKYIINASGDDFFVPDNTRFYYSKLPGVKSLRIVPNMNHYSINQFAEESLVPFINRFQSKKTLPQLIGLIHHHLLTVYFSEAPVKVVRWTANNPNARDFRYACGIRYQPLIIDIPANNKISITLNEPKTGWEATYIEATFNDGYVATSQVYITPDEKYPQTAPPSVNAACQTLPGRGLGENDSPD